jgi:CRISPR/Cas system endoribonuclease Cas6 (RAMP superfamily)
MASSSPVIRLGTQEFRALPPHIVASTDWEELLVDPPDSPWMDFELVTPTAHHSPGPYRKSIVLPTPELYFGSWLGRWNLYCEEFPMPQEILEVVADRVAIGACTGGTRALSLERGRMFIGFQGSVRFQVLKPDTLDTDAMRALWALARLASYSGTGVETMRGMGQTRLG